MLPTGHWAREFSVTDDDVDFVVNFLLEKETPLKTETIAAALIQRRLEQEASELEQRYEDAILYDPSRSFEVGQKLVFPALDFELATVDAMREGENPDYGDFKVMTVNLERGGTRDFAAEFQPEHRLTDEAKDGVSGILGNNLTAEQIIEESSDIILPVVEEALDEADGLVRLSDEWFPLDLMIDPDEGHLNLAEAVLDMAMGGPLPTDVILEQIGGISDASSQPLQRFSMNFAMNMDDRFDEVGPAGEVLWYLRRMKPEAVQHVPSWLRYTPVQYDRAMLTDEMLEMEIDIADELSPLDDLEPLETATIDLIYSHRRAGTLPLNYATRHVFPSAERTDHIFITLVDTSDGEEFVGWIVPEHRYVYGLLPIYNKHTLPVGALITARPTDSLDRIELDLHLHRPHSEWVRLLQPKGDQLGLENTKRSIGAEYDDLLILGIEDLPGIDAVASGTGRRTLASLLKMIVPELGRLTPQGAAHIKTIYSVLNVLRRCPPGPIMATLEANPEFQNIGGGYWKLADD